MYGKHFESMYEGSMYGAGLAVFAVMGYVIAKAIDSRVELNPQKLAHTLGGTLEEVESAITYLTQPDPHSRHKTHDGCRLVKEGEFQYFVPSWEKYDKLRNEVERRESNRIAQQRHREKIAPCKAVRRRSKGPLKPGLPLNGEVQNLAAVADGAITQEEADARAAISREHNREPDPF